MLWTLCGVYLPLGACCLVECWVLLEDSFVSFLSWRVRSHSRWWPWHGDIHCSSCTGIWLTYMVGYLMSCWVLVPRWHHKKLRRRHWAPMAKIDGSFDTWSFEHCHYALTTNLMPGWFLNYVKSDMEARKWDAIAFDMSISRQRWHFDAKFTHERVVSVLFVHLIR